MRPTLPKCLRPATRAGSELMIADSLTKDAAVPADLLRGVLQRAEYQFAPESATLKARAQARLVRKEKAAVNVIVKVGEKVEVTEKAKEK